MKGIGDLDRKVSAAVKQFWLARENQTRRQIDSGRQDQGARGAVTGGKQMDGFVSLTRDWIANCGLDSSLIYTNAQLELPGFFRPEKKWDLVVVENSVLIAAVEFKSQIGPSFG